MLRLINTEEWVGGRFEAPFYVAEHGDSAPHILMWLDAKRDKMLGIDIVPANAPTGSLAAFLAKTIQAPGDGPPRRPAVVRTENAREAEHLENQFPNIKVVIAATPELEVAKTGLDDFLTSSPDQVSTSQTYHSGGASSEDIARFFKPAMALHHLAPWKYFEAEDYIEVDIPALGLRKACIITIGQMNQDFGILMFESMRELQTFFTYSHLVMGHPPMGKRPPIPVSIFSVNFDPAESLPPQMIREAMENGWASARQKLYPTITKIVGAKDHRLPPGKSDYQLAAVLCAALSKFLQKHGAILKASLGGLALPQLRMQCTLKDHPEKPVVTIAGVFGL